MKNIDYLIKALLNGEVVALPTDGVFGLFCTKNNKEAINKIYELKNRSWDKKLCEYSQNIDLYNNINPIGITYIKNNTGYRSSKINKYLDKIIEKTGDLVGTSCNLSNHIPITQYKHISFDIPILDENCEIGIESTIIKYETNEVIRSGFRPTENIIFHSKYIFNEMSDIEYKHNGNCLDLAKNFWAFINEYKSINIKINHSCYLCNLMKKYIEILKNHNINQN